MKNKIAIFLLISILFVVCAKAEDSTSIIEPKRIADEIRNILPNNWHCVSDHSIIYISYDKEVTLLNPISLPTAESQEEILKDFGFKSILTPVNKIKQMV